MNNEHIPNFQEKKKVVDVQKAIVPLLDNLLYKEVMSLNVLTLKRHMLSWYHPNSLLKFILSMTMFLIYFGSILKSIDLSKVLDLAF